MDKKGNNRMLDLNCFTTSYKRPYFIYNCINNILNQNYVDISYSVNINIEDEQQEILYGKYLSDFSSDARVKINYALNEQQHLNYLRALSYCNNYDNSIYIKIDDDDLYKKDYISSMVKVFEESNIDVLSCVGNLTINNSVLSRDRVSSIGNWSGDNHEIQFGMPPTYIFNKKAKDIISNLTLQNSKKIHNFEDASWREVWRKHNLKSLIIDNDNFIYHIHGKNISSNFLLDNTKTISTQHMEIVFCRHNSWSSYIILNKRNNKVFNINNNDHGSFEYLKNNLLKIRWNNWPEEVFRKKYIDNQTHTYEISDEA